VNANARTKHWETLTLEERHRAIRRLHQGGFGIYEISNACQLSIEAIRAVLEETDPCEADCAAKT
jgi:hypothetical protein